MLLKLLPILVVAALVHGRSANSDDKDVDTLIREIFGDETTKSSIANPTKSSVANTTKSNVANPTKNSVANTTESSVDIPTKKPEEEDTCKLRSGEQGVCVPYYLCENMYETQPPGVVYIGISDEDGDCSSYIEVCCPRTKMTSVAADQQ